MLEILNAFRHEGYDAHIKGETIYVSIHEFDLYRVTVKDSTIFLKSVDTGRTVEFDYNQFLLFLES